MLSRPFLFPAVLLFFAVTGVSADTFVVTTVADSGAGSLRQAITDANAHPNSGPADRIHFNIPGAGVRTIVVASALPSITESLFLDGWSQPGFSNKPLIELTTTPGLEISGLYLASSFITVRGLIVNRFNTGIAIGPHAWSAVQGCYIGTDQTGMVAVPNGTGVAIAGGSRNLIGGSGKGAGNLISGNTGSGILLHHQIRAGEPDVVPQFNTIQGNFIGTDVAGSAAVPNQHGILSSEASGFGGGSARGHQIGGTIRSARNVISGNAVDGIKIERSTGMRIQGNLIGTGADGMTPLGNRGSGIQLVDVSESLIGSGSGPNLDAANTIGYNGGGNFPFSDNGIVTLASVSNPIRIRISANSIHHNLKLGVDLGGNGVTQNDPDHVNFREQNFPVITHAFGADGQLTIYGSLASIPSTTFTLEFFASQAADSSGFGEGQIFLGQANVTTNSSGDALFNVTFPLPSGVAVVSATAIRPDTSTSEFSAAVNIVASVPTTPPTGPTAVVPPTRADQLLNLSTRLRVGSGDNAMIGGFIVSGTQSKKIIVRGIGPSLAAFDVPGFLADPTLELYDSSNQLLATNDNWRQNQQGEIQNSGFAPANDSESAIVRTLPPGNYTAVLRGKDNATGVGLVEIYDLDAPNSNLGNVSTRGFVGTGDDVMIAGFIAGGTGGGSTTVAIRGLGPALASFGVANFLADPMLQLRNANGAVIQSNDDWGSSADLDDIRATGLAPENSDEAMILYEVSPGNYTAILSGTFSGTGVGLLEVYNLR